jgi:hypothetical protein
MENDKDITAATSKWLQKLSFDEPSENFQKNIMQSVFALERKKENDNLSYWWFLLLIPAFVAGGWFLSTISGISVNLSGAWQSIQEYYFSVNTGMGEFFNRIKSINISPAIILIFLAVLSLLIVEDIFSKSRQKLKTDV